MNKAIEIAKKKGYYSIKDNNITPTIIFNEAKAQWEISSTLYNHSNKGNCKFTNGCTIVTKTFICIDAKKGKVNEKHKNEESFPNYE